MGTIESSHFNSETCVKKIVNIRNNEENLYVKAADVELEEKKRQRSASKGRFGNGPRNNLKPETDEQLSKDPYID